MWCLRYFQFECLLHLQSQAAQALHLKLDEFEFSQYFIEINKENTSLNLPFVCSCGGLVWQNVLPLNYLKVGFKWLSTQCCAFAICISSIIPWVLTICKDISVKKFWQMVLVLKRLRKEKCVGVVPFAKHQKTCEKEMCQSYTICKTPENVWERNVSELCHLQNTRKRVRKKCVRVIPFAKHQITCGRWLKQITLRLKRKPGIGQTRL